MSAKESAADKGKREKAEAAEAEAAAAEAAQFKADNFVVAGAVGGPVAAAVPENIASYFDSKFQEILESISAEVKSFTTEIRRTRKKMDENRAKLQLHSGTTVSALAVKGFKSAATIVKEKAGAETAAAALVAQEKTAAAAELELAVGGAAAAEIPASKVSYYDAKFQEIVNSKNNFRMTVVEPQKSVADVDLAVVKKRVRPLSASGDMNKLFTERYEMANTSLTICKENSLDMVFKNRPGVRVKLNAVEPLNFEGDERHGQVPDPVQLNVVDTLHFLGEENIWCGQIQNSVQVQNPVQLNAVEPLNFEGEENLRCKQGRNSVLDFSRKEKDRNLSSSVFNNWIIPEQFVGSTQATQMTSVANQEGWKEGSMVPEKSKDRRRSRWKIWGRCSLV